MKFSVCSHDVQDFMFGILGASGFRFQVSGLGLGLGQDGFKIISTHWVTVEELQLNY